MELLDLQLRARREVGDRRGEGVTLNNLGALAEQRGRLGEADQYYQQSLAVYESIGAEQDAQDEREALALLSAARAAGANDAAAPRDPVNYNGVASGPETAGAAEAELPPAPLGKAGAERRTKHRWWPWGRTR